ncbi:MAG: LPS export ABC transporter periplasmic protein LptC [Rhizobiales bacterium]|jgi:lipopolysaccharide export system protein LptC|nr:LPS export ABC transporter periplasmic protein LptC [Hyphomicrobiales bacterium]
MELDQAAPVTMDAHTAGFRPDPAVPPESGGAVEKAFRRARRHSRAVRVLKILLPGLAILIALVFTAYSYLLTPGGVSIDILGSSYSDGKLTMANPKLDGFTRENRPYSMRAARAVQDVTNTSVFELDDIQAKLPISDGNWANVVAAKGIYNKDKNTLDVPTEMTVTTTDGMVAKLKSAFVNIGSGDLKTSDPVDITLQGSHITADSLTVGDRGKVLVFDEKVRLTMMPEKKKPAEGANGATDAAH